jgi:hypothetical protein
MQKNWICTVKLCFENPFAIALSKLLFVECERGENEDPQVFVLEAKVRSDFGTSRESRPMLG